MSDTFTIKIDGREIPCRPGDKVLKVALDHGIHIPHYCYHQGLTIAGNCRMCLCKSNKAPKPVIACATDCVPGLEIDSSSGAVKKLQESVMEFLLINHPLDCPVCDQAGECRLQDYAHEYGRESGRFREAKNVKPDIVVGPRVALWKQRCIACSRCIRFCDEISGTGELRFVERGDRVEIETFPGIPLDNPLSGNVVDICPVGALVSTDFLYQARVWNLKRTPSICPGCSKGCNVEVDVLATKWDEPEVKRLVPRENLEVNQYWMCDAGRDERKTLHGKPAGADGDATGGWRLAGVEHREWLAPADDPKAKPVLVTTAARFEDAAEAFARACAAHPGKIAIVGNLWQTVEELALVGWLAKRLGARVGLLERPAGKAQSFPGFAIPADKNPNRAGARTVLGDAVVDRGMAEVQAALDKGEVAVVLVMATIPGFAAPEALVRAVARTPERFIVSLVADDLAATAEWLMPGATWAEKDGTYINDQGRLQRLARAFTSPGEPRTELEILQVFLAALGARDLDPAGVSAAGVFERAAGDVNRLRQISYPGRGSQGTTLAR